MAQFLDLYKKCFITSGKNPNHGRLSTVGFRFNFNPLSWFAQGEQGVWYDPSDLTSLFQDSTGVTPMAAVGTVEDQPVGLMLDKSKGLALGAELCPSTNYSSGWTAQAGVTLPGTTAVYSNTISGNSAYFINTLLANAYVEFTYTITSVTSGGFQAYINERASPITRTTAGTYTERLYSGALANTAVAIRAVGATTGVISNISVKQIAGNHAFQATSANRPILSARVNLLTKTEDFSDGYWVKGAVCTVSSTKYIAPSGLLSANKIQVNSTGQAYVLNASGTAVAGLTSIKLSVSFANAGFNFAYMQLNETGSTTKASVARINLTTGDTQTAIVAGGGLNSFSVTKQQQDNGYWLLNITWTTDSSATNIQPYIGPCDSLLTSTATVSGTSGIYIYGADLRPTNSGALLPPYQRVNTASDYDSVGFPLYLKCNGLQSAMSTNSIDFTSTDKMTVVTGVRKLSDGAALLLELSAATSLNNGSFYVSAPENLGNYGFRIRGALGLAGHSPAAYLPPISNVLSNSMDTTGLTVDLADNPTVNGVRNISFPAGVPPGGGTFGNYPLYLLARAGTSFHFNGQFYGAIIRGAQSDTASVVQTEQYMATKTGITF